MYGIYSADFIFGIFFCFVGLTLMLDWGIWTIFFFLPVYYWGWYSTKLLSMFWFFLLGIGVLSLRRRSLDYLILSLCDFYYYSVFLSLRLVIIVKSFSILLILAISRIIRFFFLTDFLQFYWFKWGSQRRSWNFLFYDRKLYRRVGFSVSYLSHQNMECYIIVIFIS